MTKNKNSTRYYSSSQEQYISKLLGGHSNSSSGSSQFNKGDVYVEDASLLIECKTSMTSKNSFSIKKDWIEKNSNEAFIKRFSNTCIVFNFEPNGKNYFLINERLMKYLVDKLKEDYK